MYICKWYLIKEIILFFYENTGCTTTKRTKEIEISQLVHTVEYHAISQMKASEFHFMMIWLTLLKKYFILGEKSIFCCCQKQQKVLSPLQCCLKKRRNISVLSIRLLLKMINSKSSSPLERFFKELLSKCCHKVDFFYLRVLLSLSHLQFSCFSQCFFIIGSPNLYSLWGFVER